MVLVGTVLVLGEWVGLTQMVPLFGRNCMQHEFVRLMRWLWAFKSCYTHLHSIHIHVMCTCFVVYGSLCFVSTLNGHLLYEYVPTSADTFLLSQHHFPTFRPPLYCAVTFGHAFARQFSSRAALFGRNITDN